MRLLIILCCSGLLFTAVLVQAEPETAGQETRALPVQQVEPPVSEEALVQPESEPAVVPTLREQPAKPEAAPRSNALPLSNLAISLALVVLLVLGLAWGFKKLTLRLPGHRHMKVITSIALGPKERLLVIEMQGKQRVIGVTSHSINLLFELENPLPEEKLASDFHTQLQSLLKK